MKGFLAACLAAAPEMASVPLARPLHLAFSYDEEVGCVGARDLAERLRERPVRPEACIVGEPTGMGVVVGHKGKRSVRATVRGLTLPFLACPLRGQRGRVRRAACRRNQPDGAGRLRAMERATSSTTSLIRPVMSA